MTGVRRKPVIGLKPVGNAKSTVMWLLNSAHGTVRMPTFGALVTVNDSVVIEVKVSHSDFLADKKKFCRSDQAEKLKYQAGRVRWYLCPEGVIKKEELPEKWGLLYWDGKKVYPVVAPKEYQNTSWADMQILTSILRREGFREGIFNYRGTPSTIQGKTINGIPEREWLKQQKNNK